MKKIILPLFILTLSLNLFGQTNLSDSQKQELIIRHNYYRQIQGAVDINWSTELEQKAQKWAKIIAKKDRIAHSTMEYGENIYVSTAEVSPSHVVDRWASEKEYYHGEKISNQNYHLFGHYTQIIWNSTIEVGCAEATSKTGKHFWVCEYSPAGNYLNEKPVENYNE